MEIHVSDSKLLSGTQEPCTVDPNKNYLEAKGGPLCGRFFGLGAKTEKWYGYAS